MKRFLLRCLTLTLIGDGALVLYVLVNRRDVEVPEQFVMPDWVPFWPWMAWPYLGMLVLPWFLPLFFRDPGRFRRSLEAFVWAFAITLAVWIALPTELPRPAPVHGWGDAAYRWLLKIDRPRNVLPCGHVLAPVIFLWAFYQERKSWRWPLVLGLAFGMVSIATTWQHRPADIALGTVIAIAGIVISGRRGRAPVPASGG